MASYVVGGVSWYLPKATKLIETISASFHNLTTTMNKDERGTKKKKVVQMYF